VTLSAKRRVRAILPLACLIGLAFNAPRVLPQSSEPTARVIGRVTCADTKAPARFARVTLEPVPARTDKGKYIEPYKLKNAPHSYSTTTDIYGGFAIDHVAAGSYYVLSDLPGYVNRAWQFTAQELEFPTPEVLNRMGESFSSITVDQGQTAQVEILLQRGAVLSGSIRYDDGSPAAGLAVRLIREEKNPSQDSDKKIVFRELPFSLNTDDLGRFRIAGLPAGDFIVKCTVRQITSEWYDAGHRQNILVAPEGDGLNQDERPQQSLSIYSGGTFRPKDASPIKLGAGSSVSAEDIIIPISQMYRVSGVATSFQDGHSLDSGIVELLYADDDTKVSEAKIRTDGSFSFPLVPKGQYRLSVTAADIEFLDGIEFANGHLSSYKEIQRYDITIQPLTLDHDVDNVVVQMKPKSKDSQ